jgi:hypothetical protein
LTALRLPVRHLRPSRLVTLNIPPSWRSKQNLFALDSAAGQALRGARWGLLVVWAAALVVNWHKYGIPFDAQGLLLWIGLGLAAACFGKHPVWILWVIVDFAPFALLLFVYDLLRAGSYKVGFPAWWHPQIHLDRFLFFGHEPTVWLQEHLKYGQVRWYDVVICVVYFSYFFVPYLTAGVLWVRGRRSFYRWSLRFLGLSFFCYALFVLIPSAPPWAAARCTPDEVAGHPADPRCLYYSAESVPDGGLLGAFTTHRAGAHPWVEPIVSRGFYKLHLSAAADLIQSGHSLFDPVAAIPSLHVGATTMFCIFMWTRVSRWVRPVIVAYPLLMTFTLVYSAEHYVTDAIAGAAAAFFVNWVAGRIENRIATRRAPDTLEPPSEQQLESPCPPTSIPHPGLPPDPPQLVTTPSST